MIISRPINQSEPDLLIGNEFSPIIIKDLDEQVIVTIEPSLPAGWTHDLLEQTNTYAQSISPDGWEAYLGGQWIGSSEI
ncbi:hypothetical protein ACPHXT_004023 [Vibrio alginolyticus]|nr:hypothetical protein [Vibrio parahaemolyticus]EJG1091279.1 hypothetical protein [Vibrio parahaemolyticus]MDF4677064.1 hypothetical protein [Vibrio parahaemolyticus]